MMEATSTIKEEVKSAPVNGFGIERLKKQARQENIEYFSISDQGK